jgi:hypothetical protein
MDASAIVDYFAPLSAWLDSEYPAASCGWEEGAAAAASQAPR